MNRRMLRIRLKEARQADREIDITRSVDSRDAIGRCVEDWYRIREGVVQAIGASADKRIAMFPKYPGTKTSPVYFS